MWRDEGAPHARLIPEVRYVMIRNMCFGLAALLSLQIASANGQQTSPSTATGEVAQNAGHASESDVAVANNPIAPMNAIYLQNYYQPSLSSQPQSNADAFYLRTLFVSGRQIIRGTLPVARTQTDLINQVSGIGDVNIFDAIRVTHEASHNVLAVGPLLVAPTATDKSLGQGKWQAGAAAVGVATLSEGSLLIGIFSWQHSFSGERGRPTAQSISFQPIVTLSVGNGYYVRSSGICNFDIENHQDIVPFGAGFGKVFKVKDALVNAFVEAQPTIYANGTGLPAFQLYTGMNLQFRKKQK